MSLRTSVKSNQTTQDSQTPKPQKFQNQSSSQSFVKVGQLLWRLWHLVRGQWSEVKGGLSPFINFVMWEEKLSFSQSKNYITWYICIFERLQPCSGIAVLWTVITDLWMSPQRMEKSVAPAITDRDKDKDKDKDKSHGATYMKSLAPAITDIKTRQWYFQNSTIL